jgi:hypothetical protein
MTKIAQKPEPSFGLDMGFDEALRRFAATVPSEVEQSIKASKQKRSPPLVDENPNKLVKGRPPQDDPPRRPARDKRGKEPPESLKRKLSSD